MASNEIEASQEIKAKMPENVTVKKRERRPNYTPEEKTYLAQLVSQYQHIIDDKRTGGIFIKKKREAWKVVTLKYNSKCTTGHRQTEHLKTLYDNMKQQARKNDGECFTNTTTRLRLFHKPEIIMKKNRDGVSEEDAIKTLQKMKEAKFQFAPSDTNNHTSDPAIDPIQFLDVSLPDPRAETRSDPLNKTPEHNCWEVSRATDIVSTPGSGLLTLCPLKISKKPLSADALQRLYYKKKCRNANLERKKILQEMFHAQQKHNLEMILLRRAADGP